MFVAVLKMEKDLCHITGEVSKLCYLLMLRVLVLGAPASWRYMYVYL